VLILNQKSSIYCITIEHHFISMMLVYMIFFIYE